MEGLRRSLSFTRHRRSESDSLLIKRDDEDAESVEPKPRSSFDTFLIPNRIRYPSDKTRISEPTPFDLHIAASLLSRTRSEPAHATEETNRVPHKQQVPEDFAKRFNAVAKSFGLFEIEPISESQRLRGKCASESAKERTNKTVPKKSFFQRLSRKHSISAHGLHRPQPTPQSLDLEDLCRLGGVSVFSIAPAYAISHLLIPTALAATAAYLLKHGPETAGIFRIPGQSSIVNALYEHYKSRITNAEAPNEVEATISSVELPSGIQYNIHDVASAFKRFLWDLPGGILGNVAIFRALAEIEALSPSKLACAKESDRPVKSKLIALVLLSMQSVRRYALVCAVFGLLASLKQDIENDAETCSTKTSPVTPEYMSSHALGVVFAPILLGNLTDEIEFHDGRKKSESGSSNSTPKRSLLLNRKPAKRMKSSDCGPEIAASVSRAAAAGAVVELLVRSWQDIVQQMLKLRAQGSSRTASRNSRRHSLEVRRVRSGYDASKTFHRPSVPSMRTRRSDSLTRSISNPALGTPGQSAYLESLRSSSGAYQDHTFFSRSASANNMSSNESSDQIDSRVPSSSRNFSYSSTVLQSIRENSRWPSLRISDRRPVRSSGGSGESRPWWERSSADSGPFTNPLEPGSYTGPGPPNNSTYSRFNSKTSGEDSVLSVSTLADTGSESFSKLLDGKLVSTAEIKLEAQHDENGQHPVKSGVHEFAIPEQSPYAKFVHAKSSLDSVLSPLPRADRSSLARASYRSLQNGTTSVNSTEDRPKNGQSTLTTPSLPDYLRKPDSAVSRQARSSPFAPQQKAGQQKAKFTPSPRLDGRREYSQSSAPRSGATARSKRSRTDTSPKRAYPQEVLSSDDSVYNYPAQRPPVLGPSASQTFDKSSRPARAPHPLPLPEEPAVARRINFRPSTEYMMSARNTSSEYSSETDPMRRGSTKPNIGTLYAEIGRLKSELGGRYEEISQLRHQLDAMRRFKDSGTLSEKLRETEREMRFWKHRAQWAENNLFGKYGDKEGRGSAT